MQKVMTGLDLVREIEWKKLRGLRLGLLANQASLDCNLSTAQDVISRLLPHQLKVLFGPQHGYGGQDQDNMVETSHSRHSGLGIPIFSLYAECREPQPYMLDMIDALIIDLQDVGTRVYTFASTMLNCMKAASKQSKRVFVLDRPNPLGGKLVEGNLLRPEYYSFVGSYQFPMRHGLTMGEMALIFNHVFQLKCELCVIPMSGWRREMTWHENGLRWVMPSPNMPRTETAFVYPGQVVWEGTNLSEGRGTCRPFEIFGAPFLDCAAVKRALSPDAIAGCHLQDYVFSPTFHKWKGALCHGFMIHVLDSWLYRPYFTSIALLKAVMDTHSSGFEWQIPPYEYEYMRKPIHLILGDRQIVDHLESDKPLSLLKEEWGVELEQFTEWVQPFLLYQ